MNKGQDSRLFSDRPLVTIRVSHDSGQTWELEQAVFATDDLPTLMTAEWPPCQCRRCAGRCRRSGR